MARFRKKPVVIEAFRFVPGEEIPPWFHAAQQLSTALIGSAWENAKGVNLRTLEGVMLASPGDWIIRGVKGELYPCKPDIFEATYEAADTPISPLLAGMKGEG